MGNRRQGVGKELGTEDEVHYKKLLETGDRCKARNKEQETRCRKKE